MGWALGALLVIAAIVLIVAGHPTIEDEGHGRYD